MANSDLSQVENVFQAALDLPAEERAAYLAQACAGNESLYAEVCSLVSAANTHDSFIDKPILNLGFEVLTRSEEEAMIGRMIGSYKILSRLGKGGMGQVYLAADTRLDRKVALKFLSQELVNDNWAKRQLIKEGQAVAQLDHPNICSVYGIEHEGDHHFIVMQYVEGETLYQLIHRKVVDNVEILDLAQQLVGAIAEAHNHGIIHRDIKPGNVMVTPSGQLKVLDFGLAKIIQRKQPADGHGESLSNLSQAGVLQGTVAYMSPEQLRGEKLDYRTDVFSIGTVLYELISGSNPHVRATHAETISAILSETPVLLNRGSNRVSHQLDITIQKCLEKDREARFQSASELLLKLKGISGNPSLHNQISRGINVQALLLLAVIALVAIAVFYFVSQSIKRPSRMVVMAITNQTGDPNLEYLANGLTDAFNNRLTGLTKVQLKSPNLTFISQHGPPDPLKVGKDLGVDAVLVGNISGNQELPVLEVDLINPSDGTTIWKSQYGVQLEKVFVIETDVAKNVVASFQRPSVDDENRIRKTRDPENVEARREYWLGLYYLRNRDTDKLDQAIEHFSKAIEIQPDFARAHAGLSDCYVYANTVAYGKLNTKDAMTRAERSAKDAIDLDPSLAEAHTSLGMVNLKYYWNWQESQAQFLKAIELRPDYYHAHYGYSALLTVLGRNEEAIREGQIAKDLDPFSPPTALNYCRTLYFARRFDNARVCFDTLVNDYPDFAAGKYVRGFAYLRDRMYPQALSIFQGMYASNKRLFGPALGYTYGAMGRTKDAEGILTELLDLYKQNQLSGQEVALVYLGLGKINEAVELLQRSAEERYAPFPFLATDPLFPELQASPQFIRLIQRYNLPLAVQ